MGFDDGQIVLDHENGAYYAGQTVYGRMIFSQGKEKTIQGIYVTMKGFCKVHWTTTHSRTVNKRTHYYTVNHDSFEEYFRIKNYLFGNENGEHHLQPGQHEFKFEFLIPIDCPSTFEGTYGHIRSRVKVVMVTSGMFSMNKEKLIDVRIHAPLDLNQNPYCREPIEFELSNTYCCWCMSAGSSEVTVKMPVGGYCPGQVIPLEVTCKNDSSVEIDEIKLAIKKDVKFLAISQPGTRNEHDTVAEIKKGPVPGHTTRNWTVEMVVPAMDIYNVTPCRFIDIDYEFKVSTEISGCHSGSDETHPIIFGTIPLVGFQDNVQNPLHDQLPKSMVIQNEQGVTCYPLPPIINQPRPDPSYSIGKVYPNDSPYPGNTGYPTTPNLGGRTSPYSPGNQPYPNVSPYQPPPYPGANSPFPGANPPYPAGNSPYPAGNSPYPAGNSPYPAGNSPYPAGNSPYPAGNSPYPAGNSPYPPEKSPYPSNTPYSTDKSHGSNPNLVSPYPGANPSPVPPYSAGASTLRTGTIGFGVPDGDGAKMPLLPMGANLPYPTSPSSNPYATASAPEPSTPGNDEQKLPLDDTSEPPPYNPEYMKNNDKKDEKETKINDK